ncbi:unnamed protein product [Mytilus coruscus]|uniref:Uncharacterized protein n=1 Tax=Mytilus coruscus TaxID=42192 RepID=A0A6J8ACU2_MYTCO|nr:unnamed protein product [Mytilus coruscus]
MEQSPEVTKIHLTTKSYRASILHTYSPRGTYYVVSEDASRITFKRFQSDLIIHIDQDQNQNLQRIDAQYGVCPTVITNVIDLVVKVNTQDCRKEIIFSTTTATTVKKKTTDGTVYTDNTHQKQESITTDACPTNCPNQKEIIWGQLSTNIQIIIYAAIVEQDRTCDRGGSVKSSRQWGRRSGTISKGISGDVRAGPNASNEETKVRKEP